MKKFYSIILLLLLSVALCSCGNETALNSIQLDPLKKNLPTPELEEQIREGMTYEKVTDILGLPQYQMVRSLIVFAYKLNDGTEFAVQYSKNDSGQYIVAETNCK